MEPAVQAQYTSEVRAAVAAAVGVEPGALHDLGGFESFVHEAEVGGAPRIVKATWGARRSAEELGAEIHFVGYLADHGAPVCRPLPLRHGAMQEDVPSAEGCFRVTCWEKAAGQMIPREAFAPETFRPWGRMVGLLHRLATSYAGPPPPLARRSWRAEYEEIADLLADDPPMHARFHELLEEVARLPRDPRSFGAMHTDLHHANVFWHDGRPCVFDFDDMIDFWFVADMAIVLYYAAMSARTNTPPQTLYDAFQGPLWEGYGEEYELPEGAREAVPLFLALREQTLRAVILRSIPPEKRSPGMTAFLQDATERIRRGAPALGLRL
jgi:Ser/Thr protein kinase RdoA (MazF antagonist)